MKVRRLDGLLNKPVHIGSLVLDGPLLLAPMAGITYSPFRLLAREQGCSLTCSGLISAHALVQKGEVPKDLSYCIEEKPLAIQLVGADPRLMAEAAVMLQEKGADAVDINMGCSVRKVLKSGGGAALLKEPRRVREILDRVVESVRLPVTVKLRIGYDHRSINVLEIARLAVDCGVSAIMVHGRTAAQGFSGSVDWEIIARVKEAVDAPVIGNGGLRTPEEAAQALRRTDCDGIMIGRGALGRPWIFSHIAHYFRTGEGLPEPRRHERYPFVLRHLSSLEELFGGQGSGGDVSSPDQAAGRRFHLVQMRLHASWYSKGLQGGAAFRRRIARVHRMDELWREVEGFFLGSGGDVSSPDQAAGRRFHLKEPTSRPFGSVRNEFIPGSANKA